MTSLCISPTCDPCSGACPIPAPPFCSRSTFTSYVYNTGYAATSSGYWPYSATYASYATYATSAVRASRASYATYADYASYTTYKNDEAIVGTSVTLGIIGGVFLPICIAFVFYYRKKSLAQQATA